MIAVVSEQRPLLRSCRSANAVQIRKSLQGRKLQQLASVRIASHNAAEFAAPSLKQSRADLGISAELPLEAIRRMLSDSLPEVPPDQEGDTKSSDSAEHPIDLSEFSQRLASFGLGEVPDALLTDARPSSKRRSH